eukprot:5581154-Prymnesium_polylepis.1
MAYVLAGSRQQRLLAVPCKPREVGFLRLVLSWRSAPLIMTRRQSRVTPQASASSCPLGACNRSGAAGRRHSRGWILALSAR